MCISMELISSHGQFQKQDTANELYNTINANTHFSELLKVSAVRTRQGNCQSLGAPNQTGYNNRQDYEYCGQVLRKVERGL
jgi:hypothetical protein